MIESDSRMKPCNASKGRCDEYLTWVTQHEEINTPDKGFKQHQIVMMVYSKFLV